MQNIHKSVGSVLNIYIFFLILLIITKMINIYIINILHRAYCNTGTLTAENK